MMFGRRGAGGRVGLTFVMPIPVFLIVALSSCGLTSTPQASSGKVEVVAAENFWGSIAAQVGGDKVDVTSIIAKPAIDPHDYDPTANDARLIAGAAYVIVNGAGYDAWAYANVTLNGTPYQSPPSNTVHFTVSATAGLTVHISAPASFFPM